MDETATVAVGIEFVAALVGTGAALFSGGAAVLWMCSRMVARVETATRAEHGELRKQIEDVRGELRGEFSGLREEFSGLREEFSGLRADVAVLAAKVDILLEDRGREKRAATVTPGPGSGGTVTQG